MFDKLTCASVLAVAFSCVGFLTFSPAIFAELPGSSENQILDDSSFAEYVDDNLPRIREKCQGGNNTVLVDGQTILCIIGLIEEDASSEEIGNRSYSIAYVHSPGGTIDTAIKIGREMVANKAHLIADQHCHSACGAYIVPAARRLYITDNTVISMHGSTPRHLNEYVSVNMKGSGLVPGSSEHRSEFERLRAAYPSHVAEKVMAEVRYFAEINTNEAYVTRYREVRRNLKRSLSAGCRQKGGLTQIVGPDYLKAFRIKTVRDWFPDQNSEFIDLVPNTAASSTIVFDMELAPFWIPDKGLVTGETCSQIDDP